MTQVDFYLLEQINLSACYRFSCRFAEQAYQADQALYYLVDTIDQAQQLNDLLWTWRDISFIPHCLDNAEEAEKIRIGTSAPLSLEKYFLVNLTPHVLDFFTDFVVVIEIVPDESGAKKTAREKYKIYQQKEIKLNVHRLSA
jgi:DNA polymerase III subunit chi